LGNQLPAIAPIALAAIKIRVMWCFAPGLGMALLLGFNPRIDPEYQKIPLWCLFYSTPKIK
jgi:hypothetical protein